MEAVGCQPPESSTGSSPSPSLSEENTGNASQSKGLNSWRAPYRLSAPLAYLDDFSAQFSVPPPGYSPYHNFIRRDFTWGGAQTPSFDPTLRTDLHSGNAGVLTNLRAGYIETLLRHAVSVDVTTLLSVRVLNPARGTNVYISCDGKEVQLIHPNGRVFFNGNNLEVQVEDVLNAKKAIMFQDCIKFTSDTLSQVYTVDNIGVRISSAAQAFSNLLGANIVSESFWKNVVEGNSTGRAFHINSQRHYVSQISRVDSTDRIDLGEVDIKQMIDGMVTITNSQDYIIRVSPTNGKVYVKTDHFHVTASLGEESHMFVKFKKCRLHYSGVSNNFNVRFGGYNAGFDSTGNLAIN